MTQPSVLGVPFRSQGFQLAGVRLDGAERLVLRYETTEHAGHVRVIVLPASSLERHVARLRNISLYYEADLPARNLEYRALAAELLQRVGDSLDSWLEQAPQGVFPTAIAGMEATEGVPFDGAGLGALLQDMSNPDLPGGSKLVDLFPTEGGVCIELGSDESTCRLLLTIQPVERKQAMLHSKRLSMSLQTLGPKSDATLSELTALAELCAFALTCREQRLELAARARPSGWNNPWEAAQRPASTEPDVDAGLERELQLLAPTLRAASQYFRSPCTAEYFQTSRRGLRVNFAQLPPDLAPGPSYFLQAPEAFRRRRELAEYFRALGYFLDGSGLMRTVPTPETLQRMLNSMGVTGGGFRARLVPVDDFRIDPATWLDFYLEGNLGIHVGSEQFYAKSAGKLALRMPNRFWCEHLTAVGHHMSVHMLLTHRIAFSYIAELGAAVEPCLRRCKSADRADALLPLIEFYETDLPQVCREIWERLSTPEDFDRAFGARHTEVLRRLQQRIVQCEQSLSAPKSNAAAWKRRAELSLAVAEDVWRAARNSLKRARGGSAH